MILNLTCASFHATHTPDGFRLEIEEPKNQSTTNVSQNSNSLDPNGTRVFYIPDVARLLRKSTDTVYKMSKRKRNPIPFTRGRGRPFIIESTLYKFLSAPSHRQIIV
jgi:hypothetical protein